MVSDLEYKVRMILTYLGYEVPKVRQKAPAKTLVNHPLADYGQWVYEAVCVIAEQVE